MVRRSWNFKERLWKPLEKGDRRPVLDGGEGLPRDTTWLCQQETVD